LRGSTREGVGDSRARFSLGRAGALVAPSVCAQMLLLSALAKGGWKPSQAILGNRLPNGRRTSSLARDRAGSRAGGLGEWLRTRTTAVAHPGRGFATSGPVRPQLRSPRHGECQAANERHGQNDEDDHHSCHCCLSTRGGQGLIAAACGIASPRRTTGGDGPIALTAARLRYAHDA
jgi:hypothetical protein